MSRRLHVVFLIINAVVLLISTLWFLAVTTVHIHTSPCNKFVTIPAIFISFAILSMSLTGFYASFYKSDCLFRIYFFLLFLWVFSLICVAIFLVVLSKQTTPETFQGTRIKEYKLEEFSGWIQRLIVKEDQWYRVRNCFLKDQVCDELNSNLHTSAEEFYQMNLTPVKAGCCKPPLDCGLKYVNATHWDGKPNPNIANRDCRSWNNDPKRLCFDCSSCKAAVIANFKEASPPIMGSVFQLVATFVIGFIGWSAWMWSIQENQKQNQNQK